MPVFFQIPPHLETFTRRAGQYASARSTICVRHFSGRPGGHRTENTRVHVRSPVRRGWTSDRYRNAPRKKSIRLPTMVGHSAFRRHTFAGRNRSVEFGHSDPAQRERLVEEWPEHANDCRRCRYLRRAEVTHDVERSARRGQRSAVAPRADLHVFVSWFDHRELGREFSHIFRSG